MESGGTTRVQALEKKSVNADMLLTAFWLVSNVEFKITRSEDPHHTALLQTTGNCLGEQTFRQKIESYGNFKQGTFGASDVCLGNCSVQYSSQFQTTDGFGQATCSGLLQNFGNDGENGTTKSKTYSLNLWIN